MNEYPQYNPEDYEGKSCSFCVKAVEDIEKNLDFEGDSQEVLATVVEAYGGLFGCGDDRLVCNVLIGIMEKYGKK